MSHFVKVHDSILDSSVWSEGLATRIVWFTLLALADQQGVVRISVPGLARRANVSLEEAEEALRVLEAPDPHSQTPDFEGRRIVRQGDEPVWLIVNYLKYRERRDPEARKEYQRAWDRAHRSAAARQRPTDVSESDQNPTKVEVEGRGRKEPSCAEPVPGSSPAPEPLGVLEGAQIASGCPQKPASVEGHPAPSPLPPKASTRRQTQARGIPVSDLHHSESPEPDSPVVVAIPTVGNSDIPEVRVHLDFLMEISPLYPGIDVAVQSQRARQWCLSNPSKRKTPAGVRKFLLGWFDRQQDGGRR